MKNIIVLFAIATLLVTASYGDAGDVALSWECGGGCLAPDLAGFKAYWGLASRLYGENTDTRMATPIGDMCTIAPQPCNTYTHTISSLPDGSIYYFAVSAYDTAMNESEYSNEVFKNVAIPALSTPTGVQITGGGSITASWNAVSGAQGYQMSARSNGGYYVIIDVGTSLTYTLYRLAPETYYVKVRTYQGSSFSNYSSEASVTLLANSTLPADVSNFTANPFGTGVRLSWTNPPDQDFCCLILDYATTTPPVWINIENPKGALGKPQTYDHLNLPPGTYQYRIRTRDTSGNTTSTEYAMAERREDIPNAPVITPETPPDVVEQQPDVIPVTDANEESPTPSPAEENGGFQGFGCGTISGPPPPGSGTDVSPLAIAAILLFMAFRRMNRQNACNQTARSV
ncbi:MAG: hypothetical protein AAB581_00760 [Patescibacteria group bacterium]